MIKNYNPDQICGSQSSMTFEINLSGLFGENTYSSLWGLPYVVIAAYCT